MVKHYYACDGQMTFEKLSTIIEKYNIPHDVTLLSDSGWECDPTDMRGVRYNESENTIIFTQDNGYIADDGYRSTEYSYDGKKYLNLTLLE